MWLSNRLNWQSVCIVAVVCFLLNASSCAPIEKSKSVFISAGIVTTPHRIPTDYLDADVLSVFYPEKVEDKKGVESVGSTTSVIGIAGTLGINSWRDAANQGDIIAAKLAESTEMRHDFIAHSQGCRIALEGVYRYAYFHKPDRDITFRMVLASPKVKESYLEKVVRKVEELTPSITIQILVIYHDLDWKTPLSAFPYWLFPSWEPEDATISGVIKQIGIGYDHSFLDHEWHQMLGFLPREEDDPDNALKGCLNRFLRESIAAFLEGRKYEPDAAFRKELQATGAAQQITVVTNAMGGAFD